MVHDRSTGRATTGHSVRRRHRDDRPVALALYDGTVWLARHGIGRDDGYAQVTAYVRAHVPAGSTIVVGADVSNFLLRPDYATEIRGASGAGTSSTSS